MLSFLFSHKVYDTIMTRITEKTAVRVESLFVIEILSILHPPIKVKTELFCKQKTLQHLNIDCQYRDLSKSDIETPTSLNPPDSACDSLQRLLYVQQRLKCSGLLYVKNNICTFAGKVLLPFSTKWMNRQYFIITVKIKF